MRDFWLIQYYVAVSGALVNTYISMFVFSREGVSILIRKWQSAMKETVSLKFHFEFYEKKKKC